MSRAAVLDALAVLFSFACFLVLWVPAALMGLIDDASIRREVYRRERAYREWLLDPDRAESYVYAWGRPEK